jgi:hypothetical protein
MPFVIFPVSQMAYIKTSGIALSVAVPSAYNGGTIMTLPEMMK